MSIVHLLCTCVVKKIQIWQRCFNKNALKLSSLDIDLKRKVFHFYFCELQV